MAKRIYHHKHMCEIRLCACCLWADYDDGVRGSGIALDNLSARIKSNYVDAVSSHGLKLPNLKTYWKVLQKMGAQFHVRNSKIRIAVMGKEGKQLDFI